MNYPEDDSPCLDPNVHAQTGCWQCITVIAKVREIVGLPPVDGPE